MTRARRGPGRPLLLNPERQARIVEAVSLGADRATTAGHAGVHRATLLGWLARGAAAPRVDDQVGDDGEPVSGSGAGPAVDAADQPYVELHDAVTRAEAARDLRDLNTIHQAAAAGDWRAAEANLRMRHSGSGRYSPKAELSVNHGLQAADAGLKTLLEQLVAPREEP